MERSPVAENKEEEFDYEADLSIDPDALDVEWLEQPNLLMRYSEHLSSERARLSFLKERRDVVIAKKTVEIRSNPEEFGYTGKTSEAVFASLVADQEEVRSLRKRVIDQTRKVELLEAAVRAIDHRKQALENLVRLSGQQYFAGPRTPRELGLEYQKRKKMDRANDAVKAAMKRK